ncbi:hypothetical protein FH972_024162 [Carpinus fangiana]|uniref:UBX domain-containing protein n=1 Tax=Carpinus fangiana TaxID=176857 RepID=A0A5N6KX92_9ROSI|nr:hypothetical protein FH972_024162 [Carpinus fangiana]
MKRAGSGRPSGSTPTSPTPQAPTPTTPTAQQPTSTPSERQARIQVLLEERRKRLEADKKAKDAAEKRAQQERAQARATPGSSGASTPRTAEQTYAQQQKQAKLDAAREKERIRKLVEHDRLERREREEQRRALAQAEREAQLPQDNDGGLADAATGPDRVDRRGCMVQVRLLDGSSMRTSFFPEDRPGKAVRRWIDENRVDGDYPYSFKQGGGASGVFQRFLGVLGGLFMSMFEALFRLMQSIMGVGPDAAPGQQQQQQQQPTTDQAPTSNATGSSKDTASDAGASAIRQQGVGVDGPAGEALEDDADLAGVVGAAVAVGVEEGGVGEGGVVPVGPVVGVVGVVLGLVGEHAALGDGGAEGGVVGGVGGEQDVDGGAAGRLAEDGDLVGVAAERGNVVLGPLQGEALVHEAEVLLGGVELGRGGEAEDVGAVVCGDDNHVLVCGKGGAVVERLAGVAQHEGAAEDPEHDGSATWRGIRGWRVDVQLVTWPGAWRRGAEACTLLARLRGGRADLVSWAGSSSGCSLRLSAGDLQATAAALDLVERCDAPNRSMVSQWRCFRPGWDWRRVGPSRTTDMALVVLLKMTVQTHLLLPPSRLISLLGRREGLSPPHQASKNGSRD